MASNLFDWSEEQNQGRPEPPPRPAAEILAFPSWHHVNADKIARRLARYDDARAAFFLRKEAVKVVAQRLRMNVPDKVAEADGQAFRRAVWIHMCALRRGGLGA